MSMSIVIELQFFFISILWGVILLVLYDVLRIFRRIIRHSGLVVAVEDLLFWVASSVLIFAMMFRENDGIIRGFAIMGTTIGMVLYNYILSDYIVNAVTRMIFYLVRPIVYILRKIKKIFIFIFKAGKKLYKVILIRLIKVKKSVRIGLNKSNQRKEKKKLEKRKEKKKI